MGENVLEPEREKRTRHGQRDQLNFQQSVNEERFGADEIAYPIRLSNIGPPTALL
jgi:meiotically up-regulated gene 157 (Mug157) protein